MPMPDKLIIAEQKLQGLNQYIVEENYAAAIDLSQQLDQDLQQLFAEHSEMHSEHIERLQNITYSFSAVVSTLSIQRQQIKDSLGQIAAVKSANKISKTYKID